MLICLLRLNPISLFYLYPSFLRVLFEISGWNPPLYNKTTLQDPQLSPMTNTDVTGYFRYTLPYHICLQLYSLWQSRYNHHLIAVYLMEVERHGHRSFTTSLYLSVNTPIVKKKKKKIQIKCICTMYVFILSTWIMALMHLRYPW